MGGLVARYYLEVLGGWQDARALFSFGTPYRGSMNAVNFLANGYKQLFLDLTGVVRSLTSIYQLLPVYPVIKTGSDYVRITETDQIPHVNLARALNARAFHDEIYDAVQANQNNEAYRRQFTTVPIVGIRQPTLQSAELRDGKLTPSEALPAVLQGQGDFLDGDGTVPKISAIPYELSTSFNNRFIAETHCALQNQVQVLQGLRAAIGMPQFAGAANVRTIPNTIGLAVDDLYLPNEPLTLEARVIAYPKIFGLKAVVTPAFGEGATLMAAFEEMRFPSAEASASQHWSLTIDSLPAGLYRVTVSAEGLPPQLLPPPVHSLFEVVSAQDLNA
ncbi:MAG: lecithin--cholesterol acyltransferase, partial [Cyanobacteria bacterium J06560_2]